MIKFLGIFCFAVLWSCNTAIMSPTAFQGIPVGTDIAQVQAQYGTPYDIQPIAEDLEEHRYIQRVEISPGLTEQTNYIFRVSEGKVVSKHCQQDSSAVDVNYR